MYHLKSFHHFFVLKLKQATGVEKVSSLSNKESGSDFLQIPNHNFLKQWIISLSHAKTWLLDGITMCVCREEQQEVDAK